MSNASEDLEFALDVHGDFSNVAPDGRFLPAQLAGRARWHGSDDPAVVAVAIDGIVRATTRTYRFEDRGVDHTWSLVLPPDSFRSGENQVEIFMVREADATCAAPHAFLTRPSGRSARRMRRRIGMGVTYDGSTNAKVLGAALCDGQTARQRFSCHATGPMSRDPCGSVLPPPVHKKRIFVSASMAAKSSKAKYRRRGGREFSPCRNVVTAARPLIQIRSPTHRAAYERELGVALERIELLKLPWPPAARRCPKQTAGRRFNSPIGSRMATPCRGDARLIVTVVNQGASIWAVPPDARS